MSHATSVAKGTQDLFHRTHISNRHGLIADVTGTGKTVTLQAEPTRADAKYSTLARRPRVRGAGAIQSAPFLVRSAPAAAARAWAKLAKSVARAVGSQVGVKSYARY